MTLIQNNRILHMKSGLLSMLNIPQLRYRGILSILCDLSLNEVLGLMKIKHSTLTQDKGDFPRSYKILKIRLRYQSNELKREIF